SAAVESATETKTPITSPSAEVKSSSEPSSAVVGTPVESSSTETKAPTTTPSAETKSTSLPSIEPVVAVDLYAKTRENCGLAWQKGNLALFVARDLARYLTESVKSPILGIFGSYFHGHDAVKKVLTEELFDNLAAALDNIKEQYDDPAGVHLSATKIA